MLKYQRLFLIRKTEFNDTTAINRMMMKLTLGEYDGLMKVSKIIATEKA